MSFELEAGYAPTSFASLMDTLRTTINAQLGTSYTTESFVGSNFYKYFYGPVQKIAAGEIKTAEIFAKVKEYIATTNLRIQRPSTSLPGLIDSFAARGWVASVRKNAPEEAGYCGICVEVDEGADDYAEQRLAICEFLRGFVAAGMIFDGTEEELLTLTNGQEFPFSFHLPDKTPILLRLTLTSSDNQDAVIPSDVEIRQTVFDNINARYRLGWDFEPQRYYTQVDAPWAATITLEYTETTIDPQPEDWESAVIEAEFDDLLTFDLEDIQVLVDPE